MSCSRVLYGGELLEVIRFMELADCEQPLSAEAEVWLGALEEQKRLVEALPFVQGAVGLAISDASANANKVWAIVSCCWQPSRQGFKQVTVACDEQEKPTHLEAMMALHKKLSKEHGASDHPIHPQAAERRAAIARDRATEAGAGELPKNSLFSATRQPFCVGSLHAPRHVRR